MTGDDRRRGPEWPIGEDGTDPQPEQRHQETRTEVRSGRNFTPIAIALGALVLALLAAVLLAGRGGPDQDKLTGSEQSSVPTDDPEKACASRQSYDLIKRDLFRRAAQLRGSDQAAFDRLSASAVVRMENPVMESQDQASGRVNCSGSLSLDLPPGVQVVGGRRTLSADVDYSVAPAADGSGNAVLLRNADAIVTPLATLARSAPQVAPVPQLPPVAVQPVDGGIAAPQPPQAPPAAPPPTAAARPSFNCLNARTLSERAVCASPALASLDRQMAAQFSSALAGADPGQRALLERTRSRFLAYRERCGSDSCIASAYRGRMLEIRDIMAGTWRPQ